MHYKNARGAILQALRQNRNYCFVISLWLETYMQAFTGLLHTQIRLQLAGHWRGPDRVHVSAADLGDPVHLITSALGETSKVGNLEYGWNSCAIKVQHADMAGAGCTQERQLTCLTIVQLTLTGC